MAITVTHPFVSAIADGADATVVRPSNWNATHSLSGTVDVAVRDASQRYWIPQIYKIRIMY